MRKLFSSKSSKLISPTNHEPNDQSWKCGSWFFLQQWQRRHGSLCSGYNQCYLYCWEVTVLQHYNNVCITLHITHYTQIMQGNSWAPRTSAHGVKRNPTERMKWMHWDKIFNRHECSSLTAFIFGSYLRSSRSVYGPVTHNSLTFDHEPEYLLCVGCRNYDWVL